MKLSSKIILLMCFVLVLSFPVSATPDNRNINIPTSMPDNSLAQVSEFVESDSTNVEAPYMSELSFSYFCGGFIDSSGTHFAITNSSFLNVTLESSVEIHAFLETAPGMINLVVESQAFSACELTISGLEPNILYHHYEDGQLLTDILVSEIGEYTFNQDLLEPHHLCIRKQSSTIYIRADGSVDPVSAPITIADNHYIFTGDIHDEIVIERDGITLDGQNHLLQGSGTGNGIYLNGRAGVTITGITITNFAYAIYLFNSLQITILENELISQTVRSVAIHNSMSCIVQDNFIQTSAIGIWCEYATTTLVKGNTIDNHWFGVLTGSENSILYNHISNCMDGIIVLHGNNNVLEGNIITENYRRGITLEGSSPEESCANNLVKNNFVADSTVGISCSWAPNNIVTSNRITKTTSSGLLMMWSCNDNSIIDNILEDNFVGMRMDDCHHNSIMWNLFSNSTTAEVGNLWIRWSTENLIAYNTLELASVGITIAGSDNNVIRDNLIRNNTIFGLHVRGNSNLFIRNLLKDNGGFYGGAGVYYCQDNIFYHNSFINGAAGGAGAGEDNIWDNSEGEGNYWSDYNGLDDGTGVGRFGEPRTAGDGIGDTNIPYLGLDWYPFLQLDDWIIPATVSITPQTINLASNGNWVHAHVELPTPDLLSQIDSPTVVLQIGSKRITPSTYEYANSILVLTFNRQTIIETLQTYDCLDYTGRFKYAEFTIWGLLFNGDLFRGSDTMKIIA